MVVGWTGRAGRVGAGGCGGSMGARGWEGASLRGGRWREGGSRKGERRGKEGERGRKRERGGGPGDAPVLPLSPCLVHRPTLRLPKAGRGRGGLGWAACAEGVHAERKRGKEGGEGGREK